MLHPGSHASVTPSLVAGVASATPDPDQDANYTDARAGRLGSIPMVQEVGMPHMRRIPKTLHIEGLPTIHPNAAGMDIRPMATMRRRRSSIPPRYRRQASTSSSTFPKGLLARAEKSLQLFFG